MTEPVHDLPTRPVECAEILAFGCPEIVGLALSLCAVDGHEIGVCKIASHEINEQFPDCQLCS